MFNKRQNSKDELPETALTDAHIEKIAQVITTLIESNEKSGKKNAKNIFEGARQAPITLKEYLLRIIKYTTLPSAVLYGLIIAMLVYIDRFLEEKNYILTNYNIYRLVLTSFLCAMKFYSDDLYDNKYMALVGGIKNAELNDLELAFLEAIEFNLVISKDEFQIYKNEIEKYKCVKPNVTVAIPCETQQTIQYKYSPCKP